MNHSSPFENKEFASLFAKLRSPVSPLVGKSVVKLASIRDGDTLLDLGCGPGLISKSIMKQKSLKQVLLVDSSKQMVLEAKENLRGFKTNSTVKQIDLVNEDIETAIGPEKQFDHVIAIDLWHLLPDRRNLLRFLPRAISSKGNLTIALHREVSQRKMKEWHEVRSEIRDEITKKLAEKHPGFQFSVRSKGATVHSDEISTFQKELSIAGFKLTKSHEDDNLADVNQLVRHMPESFLIEAKRAEVKMQDSFLKKVINSAVRKSLNKRKNFEKTKIATEAFFVFEHAH